MRSRLALSLLVLLAACVSTNVALLDTSVRYVPTCKEGVVFYVTKDKAPQNYKEVALLTSKAASDWTDQQKMLESMRDKAASIGATGVILNEIAEPGTGARIAGAVFGVTPERQGKAVAIYASDDTARVRQVCSPLRAVSGASTDSGAKGLAPVKGSTAAMCLARDTATREADQIAVKVHEERDGQGCVEFRACHYDVSTVSTNEQAIARCRGEAKNEE